MQGNIFDENISLKQTPRVVWEKIAPPPIVKTAPQQVNNLQAYTLYYVCFELLFSFFLSVIPVGSGLAGRVCFEKKY